MFKVFQCLWSTHLGCKSRSGIKGPAILMEGYEEYIGVVPENILSPIAVVDIGVDDCYLLMAMLGPEVLYHYCHVVDIAKSPVSMCYPHGVMAWGPD